MVMTVRMITIIVSNDTENNDSRKSNDDNDSR